MIDAAGRDRPEDCYTFGACRGVGSVSELCQGQCTGEGEVEIGIGWTARGRGPRGEWCRMASPGFILS